MKERKELGVGSTIEEAIASFAKFDVTKHEAVQDEATGLWQVFHQRRIVDRTVRRRIRRESKEPYASYGKDNRRMVLTLYPGEMVGMRLKGRRKDKRAAWDDLYRWLVRCEVNAAQYAKRKKKADRQKARIAKRKIRR